MTFTGCFRNTLIIILTAAAVNPVAAVANGSPPDADASAVCFIQCTYQWQNCRRSPLNYHCDGLGGFRYDQYDSRCEEKCWCACDAAACPKHIC